MSAKEKKTPSSELGFGEAIQQLEGILRQVESEEIDEELRRAAELLELCREKIRKAEVEVSQIVQSLEEPASDEDE